MATKAIKNPNMNIVGQVIELHGFMVGVRLLTDLATYYMEQFYLTFQMPEAI